LNPLNEIIIELLIKKLRGRETLDELKIIRNWLNESMENKRFYDELNDIWQAITPKEQSKFDAFNALKKVRSRIGVPKSDYIAFSDRSLSVALKRILQIAALLIVSFGLGMLSFYFISRKTTSNENQLTEIVAPLGSKSQVSLPDGTKVCLNSGSKLRYFNQKSREVILEGEAFFDVTKKDGQQFLVKTKDITIRVLGTAFNVKAYLNEGSVETTLVRGSLAVEQFSEGKELTKTLLEPNQRATFIKNDGTLYLSETEKQVIKKEKSKAIRGHVIVSKMIDTEIFTAWKENRLIFRNETFESLVVKLERWYGVQINIADEEIKKYHFNGIIVNETIQDVLEIIKYTLPIRYSIQHNVIVVQKK